MSANNEIIVAPVPEDLDKYGVWYNGCVDNPFDFSATPSAVFDDFESAYIKASEMSDEYLEYGIRVILRRQIGGYQKYIWDEFPDYEYLAPMCPEHHEHDKELEEQFSGVTTVKDLPTGDFREIS